MALNIFKKEIYEPVSFEDEACLSSSSSATLNKPSRQSRAIRSSIRCTGYVIAAISLVLIGMLIGRYQQIQFSAQGSSNLDIFNDVYFIRRYLTFNGSLRRLSEYSGVPNPEMDRAWAHFVDTAFMPKYPLFLSVSKSDARMSTTFGLNTAIKAEVPGEIRYIASLEVLHQLHCLNYVRKFIHIDYYKKTEPEWYGKQSLREHADHCIDLLRQVLMCVSDTTLVTYHWVKNTPGPTPDFSTAHMCRDPEDVLRWARENEYHMTKAITRDGDVAELSEL